MTLKKLIGMAVALAVLVGMAWVQQKGNKKRRVSSSLDPETTLLQGIDLNQITAVKIQSGTNSVLLEKSEGQWGVSSLYGYPANFDKLASSLRTSAELKLGAPARTENVAESEYGFGANSKMLTLSVGGKTTSIEVGGRREGSREVRWANQHFIRKDGMPEIYLVDSDFSAFNVDSAEWIDKELLNISSSAIMEVNVGDVALKVDGSKWTLTDLDAETEELQEGEANKLRNALQYFNCMTVADPSQLDAELGFTNAVVYTASTTNETYTVTVGGEADDARYVRLSGDVPERLKNWTYVVSLREVNDLLLTRDQLVTAKEPEEVQEDVAEEGALEDEATSATKPEKTVVTTEPIDISAAVEKAEHPPAEEAAVDSE